MADLATIFKNAMRSLTSDDPSPQSDGVSMATKKGLVDSGAMTPEDLGFKPQAQVEQPTYNPGTSARKPPEVIMREAESLRQFMLQKGNPPAVAEAAKRRHMADNGLQ